MQKTLVLTFSADDRPGLVDKLSATVEAEGGNWLESRMAHLAEKFAGVAVVEVPDAKADALSMALKALDTAELMHLAIEDSGIPLRAAGDVHTLDVLGPDHPGIVHEISHALAEADASVEEMKTEIQAAPHGGGTLFHAKIRFRLKPDASLETIQDTLEDLSTTLMVDFAVDA